MNVVLDTPYISFEEDMSKVILDKIITIHYSEEVLQTNFSMILKILKQLHQGIIVIN